MSSQIIMHPNFDAVEVAELLRREYGVTFEQLRHKTRRAEIVLPRQLFYWLMRKCTDRPFSYIAGCVCRDHSSVIHGIQVIEDQRDVNRKFRNRTDDLLATANNLLNSIVHRLFDTHPNRGQRFYKPITNKNMNTKTIQMLDEEFDKIMEVLPGFIDAEKEDFIEVKRDGIIDKFDTSSTEDMRRYYINYCCDIEEEDRFKDRIETFLNVYIPNIILCTHIAHLVWWDTLETV